MSLTVLVILGMATMLLGSGMVGYGLASEKGCCGLSGVSLMVIGCLLVAVPVFAT